MKKILSLSSSKVLIFCSLGLVMTLGAFWHYQTNQSQLDRLNILNQGVGTCFNRISQTFTALMIKDIQSPYLNRGFMALSDECLSETIKGINPFKKNVGKGYETLNKLISEVHWFHERTLKVQTPMIVGKEMNPNFSAVSGKFTTMENLKVNLMDEIDLTNSRLRQVQASDEVVMGIGLLMFVLALSVLALKEFNRIQLQMEIEKNALNLLRAGNANVGAMVDQLVERGLLTQGLPVTAQIFRDYHGEMMEKMAIKGRMMNVQAAAPEKKETYEAPQAQQEAQVWSGPKTSFKEVLVSIQNINPKDLIMANETRDVMLAVDFESFEQMMNAAINKMAQNRPEGKKIVISNQIHSDRVVVNFFLAGCTFNASELEFGMSRANSQMDSADMNLMIIKEMVKATESQWHLENKADRQGQITGMSIRFTLNRVPKEAKAKNLVSVIRGKKKDISREMVN